MKAVRSIIHTRTHTHTHTQTHRARVCVCRDCSSTSPGELLHSPLAERRWSISLKCALSGERESECNPPGRPSKERRPSSAGGLSTATAAEVHASADMPAAAAAENGEKEQEEGRRLLSARLLWLSLFSPSISPLLRLTAPLPMRRYLLLLSALLSVLACGWQRGQRRGRRESAAPRALLSLPSPLLFSPFLFSPSSSLPSLSLSASSLALC